MTALTARPLAEKAINGHDPAKSRAHWWYQDVGPTSTSKADLDSISDENIALFELVQYHFTWKQLEPTLGDYRFEVVQAKLDWCAERGVPMMIWISHSDWAGIGAVPADLDPKWVIEAGTGGSPVVDRAFLCHATPRTAFIDCIKAFIDRFKGHPFVCGIRVPGETAGQADCPGDPLESGSGTYTLAKEQTAWNTIWSEASGHCDYLHYCFGFNFLRGVGGGATDTAIINAWNACLSGLPTDGRITFITPDIILPGSPDHWNSLRDRVYRVLNANFSNDGKTGLTTDMTNFRTGSSAMSDTYRFSDNPAHAFYHENGDPTYGDQAHDINSDGIIDMDEVRSWAINELDLDVILWGHVDSPGTVGTNISIRFTFDLATHTNGFGTTYGDAIGAVRQPWGAAYNPDYRDGPLTVSAVVDQKDGLGQVIGVGPADTPFGVFFGRTDLQSGDMWAVTDVSVGGVTVTPLAGGAYTISVEAGVAPGTYSFDWAIVSGPSSPESGSKSFEVS